MFALVGIGFSHQSKAQGIDEGKPSTLLLPPKGGWWGGNHTDNNHPSLENIMHANLYKYIHTYREREKKLKNEAPHIPYVSILVKGKGDNIIQKRNPPTPMNNLIYPTLREKR